jgi:hypothetical protein
MLLSPLALRTAPVHISRAGVTISAADKKNMLHNTSKFEAVRWFQFHEEYEVRVQSFASDSCNCANPVMHKHVLSRDTCVVIQYTDTVYNNCETFANMPMYSADFKSCCRWCL